MTSDSYELADIGTRFIAIAIDGIILSIIGGIVGAGGAGTGGGGIVGFLVGALYYWYFFTRQNGQTPGKMLMNIRVIKTDGTPISDVEAFLRYIGYYINSAVIMLGWIWAFIDSNNQGWHDKIASTYVVKVSEFEKAKR